VLLVLSCNLCSWSFILFFLEFSIVNWQAINFFKNSFSFSFFVKAVFLKLRPVWFSFSLTRFSENLTLQRESKVWWGLRAEEHEVVQRVQNLESGEFLLLWRLGQFCIHVDFVLFLSKTILIEVASKARCLAVRSSFLWVKAENNVFSLNKHSLKALKKNYLIKWFLDCFKNDFGKRALGRPPQTPTF
jgi:hypothetical protein